MTAPAELEFKGIRLWKRPTVKVNAQGITYEQLGAGRSTGETVTIPKSMITSVTVRTEAAKIVPDMFFMVLKPAVLTVESAKGKVELRTDKATAERARDLLVATT